MHGFGNKNNSAYYEEGNKLIIIDCGFTVFNQLKEKFDFNKYSSINIIITHLHNDHAGSLSQFILYLWFVYQKKATVISKCSKIRDYLEITGTPKDSYELKDDFENLEFIKTEHVENMDCYGFKIKLGNRNIVYTGDTAIIEPFLDYIRCADEAYIDVSKNGGVHIKIDDIIDFVNEFQSKGIDVHFMHIDDKNYLNEEISKKFKKA